MSTASERQSVPSSVAAAIIVGNRERTSMARDPGNRAILPATRATS